MALPILHTDVAYNSETLKLLIAAKLCNKSINVVHSKKDEKVVPYLSKTQLPVLEVAKDDFLFSPNSATRYLLSGDVVRNDANIDTQVDMWLQWEACQLQPTVKDILSTASGKNVSKEDNGSNLALLHSHLKYAEDKMKKNDNNLVKGQLTAADVTVWSTLYPVFNQTDVIKDWEKDYPKVSSWFKCLSGKKDFQDGVNQLTESQRTMALTESVCKSNQKPSKAMCDSKSGSKHQGDQKPKSLTAKSPAKPTKQPETQEAANDVLVNSNEISKSVAAWKLPFTKEGIKREHPILPVPGARNILITSALPYVNNVPHLGNIIGSTLSADIFSRYSQLRGYNCLYICGTDEYGTATETKAMEEGLTPQQICDKYNVIHEDIYKWFHISFDYFGRTTTKLQTEIAQDIFWKLHNKGYISEDTVDQLKCEKCDRFLADRFVEGTCPLCGFDDARGDQCDKCGKLINAIDLVKPRCKTCSNTPIVKSSRHLFLDLPKLEPDLKKHLDHVIPKGIWTNNAKVITNSWLRDGLKPRCISRDLKWGTPVPLKGFTDKVFYVWFDAPIGYISITANYTDKWEQWWKNPSQVQMYNFLGKDNVPFHSVIFPATLLGANQNYTVVDSVVATEYLNYEDGKFSKSRGVGVFGNNARDTGIPADIFRFYLVYMRPESQDTSFAWDDFQLKNNCELLNNIGNFINRALMFISNSFQQTMQVMDLNEGDEKLIAQINKLLHRYLENMECTKMRDSLRILLEMSTLGNQYMQMHKPWVLVKGTNEEKQRAGTIVSLSSNIAALLSVLLQPFMPQTSATIQSQMLFPPEKNLILNDFACYLPAGHKIGKPKPLFQKLENDIIQELKKKFSPAPAAPTAAANKTNQTAAPTLGSEADVESLNQLVTEQEEIHLDGKPVDDLRVIDLKRELDKRGLPKGGSKPQLVDRLKAQLLLEKLQSLPVDEEETVPNSKLQNDEVAGQSEFIKQYLEQQKKLFEMQREVKKRVEEEELRRKQRESEQSFDESSQESSENTDRVKEVLVDRDIQQTTVDEKLSPVESKIKEQSSSVSLPNSNNNNSNSNNNNNNNTNNNNNNSNNKMAKKKGKVIGNENNVEKEVENKEIISEQTKQEVDDKNIDEKKRKDRAEETCPKSDKKKRKGSWSRSLSSSSSRSQSRSSSSSSVSSHSSNRRSRSHSSRSRSRSSSSSSRKESDMKSSEARARSRSASSRSRSASRSRSWSNSASSRSPSRSRSRSRSPSHSRSSSVSSSPAKKKTPTKSSEEQDKKEVNENEEIVTNVAVPSCETKKNKRDEVISPAAADSDVESEPQQPKEEVAANENNEQEDGQKSQDNDATQRSSLQLPLKLQNEESSDKCDGKAAAPAPSAVPRKRKWGTSAKPTKSTTIDISTDSLKGLIPDIKPSSIKEAILDLSHDECSFSDHEEEKVEVKFRRTVQMKEEEEEVELVTTAREVLTDADLEGSSEVAASAPVPTPATAAPVEREPVTPIVVNQQAPAVVVTNKTFTSPLTVRRVSHQLSITEPEEPMAARRSPSPAHNPVSKIVHVRNLVRPFTIGQLKELLKRTGAVVENGFWIDKIKSHCFAKYETEEQAILTRKALHGTKWPSSNPKILRVEYATDDEVSYYRSKEEGPQDIIREIQQDVSVKTVKSTEKSAREMKKKEDIKKVREWDRGKMRRRSRSASCSQSRSRSRERKKRALSGEKREKKEKKVIEEEAPAKLLDDLFRKTKAVPCIYWLPLTESQIADRERERRQRQLEREQRRRELEKEEEAERKKRREMEEKRKERPERSSDKRAGSSDRARKDKREENWRPNRRPSSRSRSRSRRH